MQSLEPDTENYLNLAIQTVLYLNRHKMRCLTDADQDHIIDEMSEAIVQTALKFKEITEELMSEEQVKAHSS